MWSIVTDPKRGETVENIAGLPIEGVPRGLSSCFRALLSSPDVHALNGKKFSQNIATYHLPPKEKLIL